MTRIKIDGKWTNNQSKYYESIGDTLQGEPATRAYRAAQNHLQLTDKNYIDNAKRIQNKIIKSLEGIV